MIVALAVVFRGPAALREWMALQREQAAAAREQAETTRLDRRRGLSGWSRHGVAMYRVTFVTGEDELCQAAAELASGRPTGYVTFRVSEGGDDSNRARSIRQLIESDELISRPPDIGELEALEAGLDAVDTPRAAY